LYCFDENGTAQNRSQVDRHSLVAVAMLLLLLISAALASSDYRFQEYDINDGAVPRLNRSIFSARGQRGWFPGCISVECPLADD
jgi:hypothetical protein